VQVPELVLQEGFQLAYLLCSAREPAIEVLVSALNKLRVRSRREIKRLYWRDKHAGSPVRRMARNDIDMLQWLILFESESREREQESSGTVSEREMVIRFIKYLAQTTTVLSSFYVNLGFNRLLRNYSTAEAQHMYELLTCRFLGGDEYRRGKAVLMDKVRHRFGSFLRTGRVEHGEIRFEAGNAQEDWGELVCRCLVAFTPWSTQGRCDEYFPEKNLSARRAPEFQVAESDGNGTEMGCCHVLLDPECSRRLAREARVDAPETRLCLPRFFMPETDGKHDQRIPPPTAAELTTAELDSIQTQVAEQEARRRKINPRLISILVDGTECVHFDAAQRHEVHVGLSAGSTLVEICGEDETGEVVLGTHLLEYGSKEFLCSSAAIALRRGTLRWNVVPITAAEKQAPEGLLTVDYSPQLRWYLPGLRSIRWSRAGRMVTSHLLAAAVAGLLGWGIASSFYGHRFHLRERSLEQAWQEQQRAQLAQGSTLISSTLTRDEDRVRGSGTYHLPSISLYDHPAAIRLVLLLPHRQEAQRYRAELNSFSGDRKLLVQDLLAPKAAEDTTMVELIVPGGLLEEGYYTVDLYSASGTDHFTFRAVSRR
jgi:hypothetical protein